MRAVIWFVLLFIAAVVAATLLGRNDALVSFHYGHWRLDMSLNLFVLGLAALVMTSFGGMQVVQSLLSLPDRAREWRELKRERAAQLALREALTELLAARFARAQRASQRALELQAEVPALAGDDEFTVLAHLLAATSLHRLQDRQGRDERLALALERVGSRPGSATDGVRLLAAEWALDDRDGERGASLLAELPAGVGRRTQALRLKLQAARLLHRPMEALQTARLLAKHQGFSAPAAQALLRSLAFEIIDQAHDIHQLERAWRSLDDADRADAWVVARAARRARVLGHPELGRSWLEPCWNDFGRLEVDGREQLALALVDCSEGLGNEWLPRVESALGLHGNEAAVVAAAGMVFAERQLWGKSRRLLEQASTWDRLPATVRRRALRMLARIARQAGDQAVAANCDQRAAALD